MKNLCGTHSYIMNEVGFCPVVCGVLSSGFFVSVGFCQCGVSFCGVLSVHHSVADGQMAPQLFRTLNNIPCT